MRLLIQFVVPLSAPMMHAAKVIASTAARMSRRREAS